VSDRESREAPAAHTPLSRRSWVRWGAYLLLLLVVYLAARAWQTRDLASGVAPDIQGATLDGRPVALSDYRGAPVLLHFWATWCRICALEEQSIDALAEDYPVLTVALQSGEAAAVGRHLRDRNLDFPVLLDPDGRLAGRYGIRGVPTTLIIGPEGRIRFREVGYTTGIGLRLRLWLARGG
jgi:peroxiredoxin